MSRASGGLATSGKRWGLSCVVSDEATMGVVIGYMKLFGASDIGFDVVPDPKPKRRAPKWDVTATVKKRGKKKKLGRPKGSRSHSRRPLRDAARAFLASLPGGANAPFTHKVYAREMARYGWKKPSAQYRALALLTEAGEIKKVAGRGNYVRTTLKIVKKEAA